jgi:hypothetical protein
MQDEDAARQRALKVFEQQNRRRDQRPPLGALTTVTTYHAEHAEPVRDPVTGKYFCFTVKKKQSRKG